MSGETESAGLDQGKKWFLGIKGKKLGPFTTLQVETGLETKKFPSSVLGWKEGMENWVPLDSIPDFTEVTSVDEESPPPLPKGESTKREETRSPGPSVHDVAAGLLKKGKDLLDSEQVANAKEKARAASIKAVAKTKEFLDSEGVTKAKERAKTASRDVAAKAKDILESEEVAEAKAKVVGAMKDVVEGSKEFRDRVEADGIKKAVKESGLRWPKWAENRLVVLILLLVFFPVGVYALYRAPGFRTRTKGVLGAVFGLIFLLAIFSEDDPEESQHVAGTRQSPQGVSSEGIDPPEKAVNDSPETERDL